MKKIFAIIAIVTALFLYAGTWDDLIDPTKAIVVSNKTSRTLQFLDRQLATNQVLDLGRYYSREYINKNIHTIYAMISDGRLGYTTNGLVPSRNF